MRDTFSRRTLEIRKENRLIQIDMNCKNISREDEEKLSNTIEKFFKEVEEFTGWK